MVALELCTTSVITKPVSKPRIGTSATCWIMFENTGLVASGFITEPMISIPSKSRPKPKIVAPIDLMRSFLAKK